MKHLKHIRKFNESSDRHLEVAQIIKDIFSELIDDVSIQVEVEVETYHKISVTVKPWTKTQAMAQSVSTEKMISIYEKYLELVKDIEVCYKRVLDSVELESSELNVAVDNRIYMYFNLPFDIKTSMKWTDVDDVSMDDLFRDID